MKISDLLLVDNIQLNLNATNKSEIIDQLVHTLSENGYLSDEAAYKQDIWDRENTISTEVGAGIAIPHAKSAAVKQPGLAFGRSLEGVTYDKE